MAGPMVRLASGQSCMTAAAKRCARECRISSRFASDFSAARLAAFILGMGSLYRALYKKKPAYILASRERQAYNMFYKRSDQD